MNINIERIRKMDFIQKSGVKIPNSVIVSGVTQVADQDEQVVDFLREYGSIEVAILVDDSKSEFYQNLIIEFSSGSALVNLEPLLPFTHTVQGDPCAKYVVKALSSVYTTQIGSNATKTYLAELKGLAKLSGKDYGEVLKEMMSRIGEDIEAMKPVGIDVSPSHVETPVVTLQPPTPEDQQPLVSLLNAPREGNRLNATDSVLFTNGGKAPSLSVSDINPAEIQKVVVEHIVRSEGVSPHLQSPVRLRSFSGKVPRPSNEADYDTWRSHIELLLNDPSMSHLQISRRILECLLSPAADVVKGLRPGSPPIAYLQLLDSAFGTVEDGEELFAQFMNTLQDPGEKPSTYLHRLQLALNLAVRRGGAAPADVDKHLLKQFCRGCWDNSLLSCLQLEQKKSNPPSFADLLLLLRTEEDRQLAKASRMKKHIGTTRQRGQLQLQSAWACAESREKSEVSLSVIEDLGRQVASLQSQLTYLMAQKKTKGADNRGAAGKSPGRVQKLDRVDTDMLKQTKKKQTNRPRPWYCFNCGEDGHIAPVCTDRANSALVAEKKKKLEEKQQLWDAQNRLNLPLND